MTVCVINNKKQVWGLNLATVMPFYSLYTGLFFNCKIALITTYLYPSIEIVCRLSENNVVISLKNPLLVGL